MDAGCAPPGPLAPGLAAGSRRWEGRSGPWPQSPDSLFRLSPPRCLPGPVWAPSPGHGGARGPRWARPEPEGPAALLLLRGGGRGEGLAPGPGALSSCVPSSTRSRTRRLPGCRRRLPAARRRPPPCPSSRPASFSCRPPPSARFHGNWAKLAQTASLPRTPGDARLLRGARTTPPPRRARARFTFPGSGSHAPRRGGATGSPRPCLPKRLQDWKLRPFHMLPAGPENATKTISTCLIIYSHSITSQFQTFILRFFWVRPSVRCSSTISFQEIPYPFYRLETEAHSSKTTCLGIQGSWAPYWQPGLVILILVLLPQARAVPHTPQQTCTTHV